MSAAHAGESPAIGGAVNAGTKPKKKRKSKRPKEVTEDHAKEEEIHVVDMNDAVGEEENEEDVEAERREQEAEWALEEEDADDELIEFLDPSPPVGLDVDPANPRIRHSSTLNMRRKSEYLCRVAANRAVTERKSKSPSSLAGMITGMFSFGQRKSGRSGGAGASASASVHSANAAIAETAQLAREAQLARVKLCVDEMRRHQQRRREARAGGTAAARSVDDGLGGASVGSPLSGRSKTGGIGSSGKGRSRRARPVETRPGAARGAATLIDAAHSGRSRSAGAAPPAAAAGSVASAEGGSSSLIPKVRSSFISNLRQMVAAADSTG